MILDHEKQSLLARFFKLVRDFETSLGGPVAAGAPVDEQGLYDLSDATSREFLLAFAEYLPKRFGWSASQGPIQAIFDHETERPLARFFEIVHDFRGSLDTPPKTRA